MFNDSDYGDRYAGEGRKIIRVYQNKSDAVEFIKKWNEIFAQAEKEEIVYPVQKYNKMIKNELGFVLDDIEQNGTDFKLVLESLDLIPESQK